MKSLTYIVNTIIGLALSASALAAETTGNAHLHQINHSIHKVQHHLRVEQHQAKLQQHALESLETSAAQVALAMHSTTNQIKQQLKQIQQLQAKSSQYEDSIATQRKNLSNNIRTIYMFGKHSDLELLLEQSDPSKAERMLTYYQYLNKQHIQQINTLKATLLLAQKTLLALQKSYQQLRQLKAHEQQQLASMKSLKIKRNKLINKIKNSMQSESQKLQNLLHDKHQLEKELHDLATNPLYFQALGKPFSQLKHHLSWPTKGKLVAKYGTKFDKSQLRWKGVLFKAHMDQPVYAVADGKVIFARWLEGYGLLIIIYHGQGYMTLYGRNHYLYKKTGDVVRAGDQIAAVGDTGGHETPSLYFAIRHNTLPLNPVAWFEHA